MGRLKATRSGWRLPLGAGSWAALTAIGVELLSAGIGGAAGPARSPVTITAHGRITQGTLVPKLAEAVRRYFPGFRLPALKDVDAGFLEYYRQDHSKDAVPFVCTGDFDGNGLPDVALILVGRGGHYRVAAFHQRRDGSFVGYRLYSGHSEDSGWSERNQLNVSITREPKGVIDSSDDPSWKMRLRHEAVYIDWDETASRLYYFTGRRYDYAQQGD